MRPLPRALARSPRRGPFVRLMRLMRLGLLGALALALAASRPAGGANAESPPLRILALGDSYTIGEGVPAIDRWPLQLARRLAAEGRPTAVPTIIARTGWDTEELLDAIGARKSELTPPYDLVTVLIGVNNQFRRGILDAYARELDTLLGLARELAGARPGRVLVISIPDWAPTPYGRVEVAPGGGPRIGLEIDRFNAAAEAAAATHGAVWVEITALSRLLAADSTMFAGDGLHPSGAQYGRWVERILPAARSALADQGSSREAP